MLHREKELFEQVILRASADTGIEAGIIEKDYYVTLLLKRVVERVPEIVFKGGTSLSKCYGLIARFSEDIDLAVASESHLSEGRRKKLHDEIIASIEELGFGLMNREELRSRRDFNRFEADYPSLFPVGALKEHLIVETAVAIKPYPYQRGKASCLLCDYLQEKGFDDLIEKYGLSPFELNVQTVERTMIDKVFALGDYYLAGTVHKHSRHIYDVFKILSRVALVDSLKQLVGEVREERRPHKSCRSAQAGVDMNSLLHEIIEKDVYRQDYKEITAELLFEEVSYETAIGALSKIVESGIFD